LEGGTGPVQHLSILAVRVHSPFHDPALADATHGGAGAVLRRCPEMIGTQDLTPYTSHAPQPFLDLFCKTFNIVRPIALMVLM